MSNPSSEKKEDTDICVLELLNIPKPLKESCFSEKQIDMLFNLWKEFMYDRFKSGESPQQAREDVDRLYSSATTIKRKYNALRLDQSTGVGTMPAMAAHEKTWVMGNSSPTPFIAYLRRQPEVMEILRMSFKPALLHSGMMEAPDFIVVLLRYIYWLRDDKDRTLNVLGVTDDNSSSGMSVSTESMIGNLQKNWVSCRFHLAVLNEGMHWRAVLIDKVSKTFEYYDPKGTELDLSSTTSPLAMQVAQLYETARALESGIITKSMHTVMRGFHKHQKEGTECGMYVLLFIHTRISQQKSFEYFAETEIKNEDCKKLKSVFFTLSSDMPADPSNLKTNHDYRLKFGDYDIRLAALDFARYMGYVLNIVDQVSVQQSLKTNQKELLDMVRMPGDYIAIRIEGMKIQKNILAALPGQFKTYAGSDIWFNIIQEVVQDPLTRHLRKISTKNTLRKKTALKIYNDMTGWSLQLGAPTEKVMLLNAFIREIIDNYYVPILRFDSDNTKRFESGMSASSFVRETMSRRDSVSFGVHFMREVHTFITSNFQMQPNTELTSRFAMASMVVKPISVKNITEIKTRINMCDDAMREAYELLKNTFTERMMITSQVRSPSFGPVSLPMQSAVVQPQIIEQIIQLNKKDLQDGTFLSSNTVQPWNFPLNVPYFNTTQTLTLPSNFNIYSLNEADMKNLLGNENFKVFYAMGVFIAQHYIATGRLKDLQAVQIMLISLVQFYNATENLSENRKIMCTLIATLYNAVRSPNVQIRGLDTIIDFVSKFYQSCQGSGYISTSTPFFEKVKAELKSLQGNSFR
jgi:hypothetical protein